jgi:hypothetical protein
MFREIFKQRRFIIPGSSFFMCLLYAAWRSCGQDRAKLHRDRARRPVCSQLARIQFSYGSEHVSHGATAAALMVVRWIDERLGRLWKLQGPAVFDTAALAEISAT